MGSAIGSVTIPAMLGSMSSVVGQFGGLIVLVVGLSLGFGVVSWIIAKGRSAMN